MSSVQLQTPIRGTIDSSSSLNLEPHDAAEQQQNDERFELHPRRTIEHYERTREECVRLAAQFVHSNQLQEAIELVQHYMAMPGITTTPAQSTTPSTVSVTSHVGGTQAFINQVQGAVAELEATNEYISPSAEPVATACRALGQLLSIDPYNSSILGLLKSLHAARMQQQSSQSKSFGANINVVDVGDSESQLIIDGGSHDVPDHHGDHGAGSGHRAARAELQDELIGKHDDAQPAYNRHTPHRNVQIWWRISASPDELLDLNDAALLDRRAMGESNLMSLPGGRLHVRDPENDPMTRGADGGAQLRHATLRFLGHHKETDYALLAPGTEFTLQCQGLEERAHELTELDIIIRVVKPQSETDHFSGSEECTNGSAPVASESDTQTQEQRKPTWPPLPFGRPPSVTDLIFEIRTTAEQAAIRRLHRMLGYVLRSIRVQTPAELLLTIAVVRLWVFYLS